MSAWAPPTVPATGAAALVAVVSERAEIAQAIASRLSASTRMYRQRLHLDGTLLEPERVAKEIMAEASAIVLFGPDVPLPLAFAIAGIIDRDHPEVSQLLVTSPTGDIWREALRTGVRDIVSPSALETELGAALERAVERAARVRDQRSSVPSAPVTGRVIVVLSPKGGSGKTMLSSNLAAILARQNGGSVVLADFDVQFGDSASALGLVPAHTLADLAAAREIDGTMLKVYLTPHEPSGLFVLCGATSPEQGDVVTDDHARRIVRLLARDFDYVVVDTAAGLDETALAVLEEATDVVLMSSLDVSAIRSLGKEIQALDRIGLLSVRRHFVLNRADARVGLEVADVETALGMEVDASVPSSRAVPLSMNQGRPISIEDPSSPVSQEIARFARSLTGAPEPAGERSRGLLRRRKS